MKSFTASISRPRALRVLSVALGVLLSSQLPIQFGASSFAWELPPGEWQINELLEDQFECQGPWPMLVGTRILSDESFTSSGSVKLGAETISGSVNTGGGATLEGTTVNGSMNVAGQALLRDATVHGNVNAAGGLEAKNAHFNANVNSGGLAEVEHSVVEGNLNVGGQPKLDHSQVFGTFSTASDNVTVVGSRLKDIRITESGFNVSSNTRVFSNYGNNTNIVGNNVTTTTSTRISRSSSHVSVGPGSVSNINGFKVTATPTETTVITRDGSIYVNGKKVHGSGPNTYGELRAQAPETPSIQGPGWQESPEVLGKSNEGQSSKKGLPATHIIRLTDNSEISGDIVFEGGQGKLIIEKGSVFTGKVEGGTVERLN